MSTEENVSDKKRGRPSKGVDWSKICVRLSKEQSGFLCDIGHDFKIYYKSHAGVNTSEVIQTMLDKFSSIKERFFDSDENGILYDNILSQIVYTSNEYYDLADKCDDDSMREHYLDRGRIMAIVASALEELNYNDLKPDVTQQGFRFGHGENTGRFMGVEQERKIDKKYNDKKYGKLIRKQVIRNTKMSGR